MDPSSLSQLNERYALQAEWSKGLRTHLYSLFPGDKPISVLEAGCGTGAVMRSICEEYPGRLDSVTGVDIDRNALRFARKNSPARCGFRFLAADAAALPFPDESFDLVFCHYLLLWVENPVKIITEMRRMVNPGGICAALAEPCYGEAEAEPAALRELFDLQCAGLKAAGAEIDIGRRLGGIFQTAGFGKVQTGVYSPMEPDPGFLRREIEQMLRDSGQAGFRMEPAGNYVYHVPTYFAFAAKI